MLKICDFWVQIETTECGLNCLKIMPFLMCLLLCCSQAYGRFLKLFSPTGLKTVFYQTVSLALFIGHIFSSFHFVMLYMGKISSSAALPSSLSSQNIKMKQLIPHMKITLEQFVVMDQSTISGYKPVAVLYSRYVK